MDGSISAEQTPFPPGAIRGPCQAAAHEGAAGLRIECAGRIVPGMTVERLPRQSIP
jgi:hypothetical protein